MDSDGGRRQRLDRVDGQIAAPSWAPDGKSLIYLVFEPSSLEEWQTLSAGKTDKARLAGRISLIRQRWGGPRDAIAAWSGDFARSDLNRFPTLRTVVAPDGLWAAAELIEPDRVVVLSIADRTTIKEIADAAMPSWSSEAGKLAYFKRTDPSGIWVEPLPQGSPTRALPLTAATQPAVWDRQGTMFLAVRAARNDLVAEPGVGDPTRIEIVRVASGAARAQVIHRVKIALEPALKLPEHSFAFDDESESLFLTVRQAGQPAFIEWFDLETQMSKKAWHPVDVELTEHPIPLGALSVSPGGRKLAFRYGQPSSAAPVGIHDLASGRFIPLIVNARSATESLWTIVEAVRRVVRKLPADAPSPFAPPTQEILGGAARRWEAASRLPLELFIRPIDQARREPEQRAALTKLTDHGLAILERADDSSAALIDATLAAEARLFFHYVRRDYAEAIRAARDLQSLKKEEGDPEYLLAIGVIEAQSLGALGERVAAMRLARQLHKERRDQLARRDLNDDPNELKSLGIESVSQTAGLRDALIDRLLDLAETIDLPPPGRIVPSPRGAPR